MPLVVSFSIWSIVGFVIFFFAVGFVVTLRAYVDRHREALRTGEVVKGLTLRQRVRRFEGPVTPDLARLNPPLRVAVEFVVALFGFPGLGWVLSTRILPGVVLMLVGPACVFGFYPVFLSYTGLLAQNVWNAFSYLPLMAAASAGTLAVFEFRAGRRRRHVPSEP